MHLPVWLFSKLGILPFMKGVCSMKVTARNLLISACGAAATALLVSQGVSDAFDRRMVGAALDRQEPELIRKKNLQGENGPDGKIMAYCRIKQRELEQKPHRVIHIQGKDGTTLVGHLFLAVQQKRVVLAMHGWRSCWARDFGAVAEFLQSAGCTVLYAEQRGQGRSGGDYMGFGMMERFDCRAWLDWLNGAGFAGLPIYLAGISMGASTVLMAAGDEHLPANVAGVIADCGFTSAKAEWQYVSEKNLRVGYKRRSSHVDKLCRKKIKLKSDDYSTLDAMKKCHVPVLFIHGADDTFVPVRMTMENYAACQGQKRLLIVPGANHGMSYFYDREGYESALRQFFREYG